ncbi:MAG: amino acid adenylation domain-containing protein [Nitrospiraceae bacterium]|nr:MAG: amino acid adenylation domain-containing protein [Nitrospiraceae bacterium]
MLPNVIGRIEFPKIEPVPRGCEIPLSFAQQRLWLHDQLEPDTPNNVCIALHIKGALSKDILQKSLDYLVERHEILRTTYSVVSGEPVQTVHPVQPVRIIYNDLSCCPEDGQAAEIRHCMSSEARQLFDLSKDPMMRTVLVRLSDIEHVLIVTMHHIASDEWSMKIFFREFMALYGGFAMGKPLQLNEMPVQYADFACWRRQWMSGEVLRKQLSFWKQYLEGSPLLLELPADRPRPTVRGLDGASHTVVISSRLTESLRSLCKEECVTMFVTMMAAFKTLLYRYTGQGDISVGTFCSNREWPEIQGLIGFFVNALVVRSELGDGLAFRSLLKREMSAAQGAFDHYDMPFEKLVETLNPDRGPGHTPLFQVALSFDEIPVVPDELPGMNFELMDYETSVSLYDLSLIITEMPDNMRLAFIYRTDLFDPTTIQRMAGNFITLLEGIVSNPDESVFTLPVLSPVEHGKILSQWSRGKCVTPPQACIHELFEAQVERTPEAVAVVYEDRRLSYRELNRRANMLAHYLRRHGVGPEVLVGIYEVRSPEMIVGLLAILKAGGAYVPLDPGYPRDRIAFMIEDADVTVLLSSLRLASQIPSYRGRQICIDADWKEISLESCDNPVRLASPENAACLLYTSGSTGKPKGAVLQHSSLVNFINAVISEYGITSSDRVLQFASISFDASAEEIYPCLSTGATLVLRTDDMLTDTDFLQKCREWGLTVISLPTAYWHILTVSIESEGMIIPDTVRLLVIGGERALPERLIQWQRHVGDRVRILNTYGPTEATVVTTVSELTFFNPGNDYKKELPVGRPIAGAHLYILDGNLQPVPIGVPGELYIGGHVLARGYLNRPDLTAEKFIPDPFSSDAGGRLYSTGDMARYLPDGNVEFMGRRDQQVKIRGFRIELGEIEAALIQHPRVREAVVVVREDQPGDQRLAAYMVPINRHDFQIREIRDYLSLTLPAYMVPSAFIMLDALPMTPNNKVDRRRLPAPDRYVERMGKQYVAPRSGLEVSLTEIWEKVLGVHPVGITDNFFEIGGHSLLAVRLTNEIRKITGRDFPVMALFHNPTVEHLARIIIDRKWLVQWSPTIMIQGRGPRIPVFSVHNINLAGHLDDDQPLYILSRPSKDEDLSPYSSVEKIAERNIADIRAIRPKGPYILTGYCFWAIVALEIAQQLIRQGEEVPVLFLIEPPDVCLGNRSPENESIADRMVSYSRNIEHMTYMMKTANVLRTAFNMIRRKTSYRNIRYNVKVIASKTCLFFGHLPLRLRHFYLYTYHAEKTSKSYVPRVYPGRAVVFYADKMTADVQEWSKYVTGGVEIHEVRGAGHLEVLREPYIGVWARIIARCLDRINDGLGR